ncbi:diguanylate cyclase response regulator [Pseudomonas straminea]|uniref:diguanylate cyclase n=1 Tax=Pseudomonas straminea TaxID=47882 RepID=A0A1I1XYI0_PSEOC|nr:MULTISPECIES: diguanylate cyclase [Pseudomonas]TWE01519.1 response regulator receiver modulated diguanylate cyclase [Pseudomonas sp. AG1028]GLX15597.1 diguanylate cyclase response regulator [Pseudomonas straminea]SFE12465.1 diguanylate cyclase (GGDEF) domain-containing protein [Pseudomonas straminea]
MRNILVIEDSPLVLKILEHLFRHEPNLQPVFCASLAEAEMMLEASAELFFAAIVDLHLPDAPDGESVDLVMRYGLPCIVLSGSYNEKRRDELLLKGVVDYVLKESQHSYEYAFRLLHRLESNSHVKILVAEDSEATRNFIRHVLVPHRYQIIDAHDGDEALRILKEQPDVDMLVVDHSMPGISGFELVKLLRQKMKRNDLVILGLSADTKGSLSAMFIKHGADDFLRKPFCPEELTCRVMFTLERRDMLRALKKAAQYDALTGLNNRRAFYEQGIQQFQQAQRSGHNLSVAMLDMDLFKQINDEYGHAAGDAALIGFSRAFRAAFPDTLLGRLGGEEFAMVSPQDGESLRLALDELREQCRQVKYAASAPPLSFSAGIYHGAPEDLESLLHLADQQLYQAKRQGRGRTVWQ